MLKQVVLSVLRFVTNASVTLNLTHATQLPSPWTWRTSPNYRHPELVSGSI